MEPKYIFKLEFTREDLHENEHVGYNLTGPVRYCDIKCDKVKVTLPEKDLQKYVIEANPVNATLADTCSLMTSSDYKDRFLAEYIQLKNRMIGLANMLSKWDKGNLNFTPTCPRCTYKLQMKAMEDYIAILTMRAKMEGIDLPEDNN